MVPIAANPHGTPGRILAFYERVSREGAAALEELPTLFTEDVHFLNPVVDETGLETFHAQWRRAFAMYKVFEFRDIIVMGTEDRFVLSYVMHVGFFIGPTLRIPSTTECFTRSGKVYELRDSFDTMVTLLQPVAPLLWLYKKAMRTLIA